MSNLYESPGLVTASQLRPFFLDRSCLLLGLIPTKRLHTRSQIWIRKIVRYHLDWVCILPLLIPRRNCKRARNHPVPWFNEKPRGPFNEHEPIFNRLGVEFWRISLWSVACRVPHTPGIDQVLVTSQPITIQPPFRGAPTALSQPSVNFHNSTTLAKPQVPWYFYHLSRCRNDHNFCSSVHSWRRSVSDQNHKTGPGPCFCTPREPSQ